MRPESAIQTGAALQCRKVELVEIEGKPATRVTFGVPVTPPHVEADFFLEMWPPTEEFIVGRRYRIWLDPVDPAMPPIAPPEAP